MAYESPYVEERDGTYYVRGQRVRLISLAADWRNGADVEEIARHFPVLKLAEVFGALAYYLEHQDELNAHFAALNVKEAEQEAAHKAALSEKAQQLHQRISALRRQRETAAS